MWNCKGHADSFDSPGYGCGSMDTVLMGVEWNCTFLSPQCIVGQNASFIKRYILSNHKMNPGFVLAQTSPGIISIWDSDISGEQLKKLNNFALRSLWLLRLVQPRTTKSHSSLNAGFSRTTNKIFNPTFGLEHKRVLTPIMPMPRNSTTRTTIRESGQASWVYEVVNIYNNRIAQGKCVHSAALDLF